MNSRQVLDLLRCYESRNVTFVERDGSWPMVWERARGVHVWDVEGRKYLDLTAAFGVAATGHANPRVVSAGQKQMSRLLHAMGDVHPHPVKATLARELSRITFERWTSAHPAARTTAKTIFCNSGFEAVEAALKTAKLATGKNGVIAFNGGYHGLGYGALNVTHRKLFKQNFRKQLGGFGYFIDCPTYPAGTMEDLLPLAMPVRKEANRPLDAVDMVEDDLRRMMRLGNVGAILVEPIQGRGGIRIFARGCLPMLRRVSDEYGVLLIVDEVFTGFGRTGAWFACEHSAVVPDLICLGKALAGGFPLSACVGRAELMDAAWPESNGEAIHTSTFLGHPVGCAMALAQIGEIRRLNLAGGSRRIGDWLLDQLRTLEAPHLRLWTRGAGLMAGLELQRPDGSPATAESLDLIKRMLHRGFILLPEGEHANVISLTPPLTITTTQLRKAVGALGEELRRRA